MYPVPVSNSQGPLPPPISLDLPSYPTYIVPAPGAGGLAPAAVPFVPASVQTADAGVVVGGGQPAKPLTPPLSPSSRFHMRFFPFCVMSSLSPYPSMMFPWMLGWSFLSKPRICVALHLLLSIFVT